MSTSTASIEQLAINTVRTLSMDAVQRANSGHPGTPMALAPIAYALWNNHLRYDPKHPEWPARDRFVLSCGHASMLLYSLLHLVGVQKVDEIGEPTGKKAITLDDIKNFRQLHSPCAGHPEFGEAPGIETTTGPLGQGIANSVGMAIAAKWTSARYDQGDENLFEYDVYALCSDGDIMEGIGCEAASLAGHLCLSNLCWIYDDNNITIEGKTELAFSERVDERFQGLGWNTVSIEDANDLDAINAAIESFQSTTDKPTLIILKSVIGYGAPNKQNSHDAHGAPLGTDEILLTKQNYGWPDEDFLVPTDVVEHFAQGIGNRGARDYAKWQDQFADYQYKHAELTADLHAIWAGEIPESWDAEIPEFPADDGGLATRSSSGQVLNAIAKRIPWMMGGSADLGPSNNTELKQDDAGEFLPNNYGGRNMHFGIREHAMAGICNGMALSGLRPFAGTFFVFTDYMRPSMRLSSLMCQNVIYILTHDSIGLGEDGPTHQPIEHLAACRAIPDMMVFRPCDANEVAACYRAAMECDGHPAAMVLTRQKIPTLDRQKFALAENSRHGGYVLSDCDGSPQLILIGTGSEISICLAAAKQLTADGIQVRVVSMPCMDLFELESRVYQDSVLPPNVKARVAVEAGIRQCWDRYLGMHGGFVGMSQFGASAPHTDLYEHFGITVEGVIAESRKQLGR